MQINFDKIKCPFCSTYLDNMYYTIDSVSKRNYQCIKCYEGIYYKFYFNAIADNIVHWQIIVNEHIVQSNLTQNATELVKIYDYQQISKMPGFYPLDLKNPLQQAQYLYDKLINISIL